MSGTVTVSTTADLATAIAGGAGTIRLANDIALAGALVLSGSGVQTIDGDGHQLTGAGGLRIQGTGTIVLATANAFTGGVTIAQGTLELAAADAAGTGAISLPSPGYGPHGALRVTGAMPANPLAFAVGPATYRASGTFLDLAGVDAAYNFALAGAGSTLDIPLATGGMATLVLDTAHDYTHIPFLLLPDGHGGTLVEPTGKPVAAYVTVAGAGGLPIILPVDSAAAAAEWQGGLDPIRQAVLAGTIVPVGAGDPLPALLPGQTLEVVAHQPGLFVQPAVRAIVVSDAPGVATVAASGAGLLLIGGDGGVFLDGRAGSNTVYAGGGDNFVALGSTGQQVAMLGSGNDTVLAAGYANIAAGAGSNLIQLGSGGGFVHAAGSDTVIAGPAAVNIRADDPAGLGGAPANVLAFLGAGDNVVYAGAGASTIIGGTGNDYITYETYTGPTLAFLGSGRDTVYTAGADTIIAGGGDATIGAWLGTALIFGGTGALNVDSRIASTVVGNPSGALNVTSQGGMLVFAAGNTVVQGHSGRSLYMPDTADTVVGVAGSATIRGGDAGGVYQGGPAGHNVLTAGTGQTTLIAGGDGDLLTAPIGRVVQFGVGLVTVSGGSVAMLGADGAVTMSAAGGYATVAMVGGSGPTRFEAGGLSTSILTGTGSETIVGGTGLALFAFANGHAPDVLVQGFDPALDYFTLLGFGPDEAATALAGATTTGGDQHLTLSDGTHITLVGFTGLAAGSFL